MVNICCVRSCKNRGKNTKAKMHRFPKDPELMQLWLEKIGDSALKSKDHHVLYNSYRICDDHFTNDDRIQTGRRGAGLKKHAIPSLLLPSQEEHFIEEMPSTSRMHTPPLERMQVSPEVCVTPTPHRDLLKGRANILKSVDVATTSSLTPKAKKLYKIATNLRKCAKRLDYKAASAKKCLREAVRFAESGEFMKLKLNKASYNFVMSQLAQQSVTPKGRRYTLDDKIFALGLMKQSASGYRLLRRVFAVPSRRTLVKLLNTIPFAPGINHTVFEHLKLTVHKMKPLDRYCTIIFDEMSLQPGIYYNRKLDIFEGFQDNGQDSRMPVLADKAMVFMARGIHRKWKQPLAYYFNGASMKSDMIAKVLKDVIRAARECGLNVVATVCDQGAPNTKAIKDLYNESRRELSSRGEELRSFGFLIDGVEVIPLFDPPHLLKCIRNNLFTYDCEFKWKSEEKVIATWRDIRNIYELDNQEESDYRMLSKLTENHINNLKKMKVSLAAQIFSQRVASTMKGLSRLAPDKMTATSLGTAEFVLFMNKCFDSLNGSAANYENPLRTVVKPESCHIDFWTEAIKVFDSMKFIKSTGTKFVPPSVKNWIHTLKGFKCLWAKLRNDGFTFLAPRSINQDPLENFFGGIRSHGVRNVNPTCQAFQNSFKSLLVNNFISPHSPGANCEADDAVALDNLRSFFTTVQQESHPVFEIPDVSLSFDEMPPLVSLSKQGTYGSVAGVIAKKTLKNIQNCKTCKSDLLGSEVLSDEVKYLIDNRRGLSTSLLLHPTSSFSTLFQHVVYALEGILQELCHRENVGSIIYCIISQNLPDCSYNCQKHNLFQILLNNICFAHFLSWSKNVNNILKGKVLNGSTRDSIKQQALQKYQSQKRR